MAACWAALISYGHQGYVDATRSIIQTTQYIVNGLKNVDGIKIIGEPDVMVVAFGSDDFNIYGLSDGMKKQGWNLNVLQFPSCIHLCVTLLHTQPGVADKFVNDIKELTEYVKIYIKNLFFNLKKYAWFVYFRKAMADPKACDTGSAAIYGMAQTLPDRSIVDQMTAAYLDSLYATSAVSEER